MELLKTFEPQKQFNRQEGGKNPYGEHLYSVIIKVNEEAYRHGFKTALIWQSLRLHHIGRWKWYYNYRLALLQVENPKYHYHLTVHQYKPKTINERKKIWNIKKARLQGAITKLITAIKEHTETIDKQNSTTLFKMNYEQSKWYIHQLNKLKQKQEYLNKYIEAGFDNPLIEVEQQTKVKRFAKKSKKRKS